MANSRFKDIVTCDFYGSVDSLDGETPLKEGIYSLQFPNGHGLPQVKVYIERFSGTAQVDMNNYPDHYTGSRAYFLYQINGIEIEVYLRENKIKVAVD